MHRLDKLEQALKLVVDYTRDGDWRPGIVDLFVLEILTEMKESDYTDQEKPEFIWHKTPIEVMEYIISKGYIFDIEFGTEDLLESIRDYLIINDFIVNAD